MPTVAAAQLGKPGSRARDRLVEGCRKELHSQAERNELKVHQRGVHDLNGQIATLCDKAVGKIMQENAAQSYKNVSRETFWYD